MRRLVPVLAAIAALAVPAGARAGVTSYPLPAGAHPSGIAQAPDGAMWALEDGGATIDRVAPDGTVARFPATGYPSLVDATFDLGGNLWFTGGVADRLGRAPVGATLGPISTWNFGPGCQPTGVMTGRDGAIWFSKLDCNVVGRIDPASAPNSGHLDIQLPSGTQPMRIATGPDGAPWFTAYGSGGLGRVAADGSVSWPVPGGLDHPYDLVTGADGNLWVTEDDAVLRVTPTGGVTRFTAGLPAGADPRGITTGADGNVYVAAAGADALVQVRPDGAMTSIALARGAGPREVAAARDGSVWFTAYNGGWIGRWTADPAPAPVPPPAPAPTPKLGSTVVAQTTKGKVRVTNPGSKHAYVLRSTSRVPVGATFDTRDGNVSITSALPGNRTQKGTFWGGFFKVRQSRSRSLGGMTTLELRSNLSCARVQAAAKKKKRKRTNSLWGSDRRGKFRTQGRNATATVRGTRWHTTDTCAGTRVTVTSGAVSVRDAVRKRTVTVRRGHSYLARNRH